MKKALALVSVLAFVAAASAGVDLFLTKGPSPGMKDPDTFNATEKNFLPNFDKWAGSPAKSPFTQGPGTTETYFLWAEFKLPSNILFAQIYGIDLRGAGAKGKVTLVDGLMYRHNKPAPNPYKRWDGGSKIPLPGLAAAVVAKGVEAPANPSDLAVEVDGKTYALLGAVSVQMAADALDPDKDFLGLGLGTSAFAIRLIDDLGNTRDYTGAGKDKYPDLTIQGQPAYTPTQDPNVWNYPVYPAVVAIPEPASMLLLCLGALLRRR